MSETPTNRDASRDYFRWDEHHHQPHTDLSTWQKMWASRRDVFSLLAMAGRNLAHAWSVYRAYRRLGQQPATPQPVRAEHIGVAISPSPENFARYHALLRELGVGRVLIRIPCWAPEGVLAMHDRFALLKAEGYQLTFALLQDRAAVTEPQRWAAFVRQAADCLADLSPAFQLGQVINRKKWGIWHPSEYMRLLEVTAPVRQDFPSIRWLGPPVIDFEYHFTLGFLFARRPFDFDGLTSLLYVDRRGSPHAFQYGHFELRRKIVLLRALLEASPHPNVPIHLTEFNWPLKGKGKHAPAGAKVQTDDERQASYLVQYLLIALATGLVDNAIWWQLVARGYGLCDEDEAWTPRPAYNALRFLLANVVGTRVIASVNATGHLRAFRLISPQRCLCLLYTSGSPIEVVINPLPRMCFDLEGQPLASPPDIFTIAEQPIWLDLAPETAEQTLAAIGLRTQQKLGDC